MNEMKVFVWEDVLGDYLRSGLMVAIAPTLEEARAKLLEVCPWIPPEDLGKEPQELDLSKSAAFFCYGC